MNNTLTSLPGVRVGHATHPELLTGCTAILFDDDFPTAYAAYGGDIVSYNTDNLNTGEHRTRRGLFIAGGSLDGLDSARPIKRALSEAGVLPNISGAVVFDQGTFVAPYDEVYGLEAYRAASTEPVMSGDVGAGTGTIVGKFHWLEQGTKNGGMKAGVGSASVKLDNGVNVSALTVLNAIGNIIKPDGTMLAGNRGSYRPFLDFDETVSYVTGSHSNTTVTVVGTNADLGPRENYARLAHLATHGHVRAINPVHTSRDGDTLFVFSTRDVHHPINGNGEYFHGADRSGFMLDVIGYAAARVVQASVYDACGSSQSVRFDRAYQGVFPSASDYIAQLNS